MYLVKAFKDLVRAVAHEAARFDLQHIYVEHGRLAASDGKMLFEVEPSAEFSKEQKALGEFEPFKLSIDDFTMIVNAIGKGGRFSTTPDAAILTKVEKDGDGRKARWSIPNKNREIAVRAEDKSFPDTRAVWPKDQDLKAVIPMDPAHLSRFLGAFRNLVRGKTAVVRVYPDKITLSGENESGETVRGVLMAVNADQLDKKGRAEYERLMGPIPGTKEAPKAAQPAPVKIDDKKKAASL